MAGSRRLLLLPLLSLLLDSTGSCPEGGARPLISGDPLRVHEQFFTSNPSDSQLENIRLGDTIWCVNTPDAANTMPWLQVEFGYDVTIISLEISGEDFIVSTDTYVTHFQIYVGSSSSDLEPLLLQNSSEPMEFERSSPRSETTTLPSPVSTRVLRIVVLSSSPSNDRLCMDLEAMGCLTQPTCEDEAVLLTDVDGLLGSITASSADSDDPAEDVLSTFGRAWCTVEPFSENSSAPYIQFNFTRRVSLTHMTARGANLGSAYVTEFRLEILDDIEGGYEPYGVTDQPTIFSTDSSSRMLYTMWRPAFGNVLRFNIINGVRNSFLLDPNFCWNVRLFGCEIGTRGTVAIPTSGTTTSEVTEVTPGDLTTEDLTTTAKDSMNTSTNATTATFADATETAADTSLAVLLTAVILGVIGGAIALIIGFIIVVLVVFFLCSNDPKTEESSHEVTTSSAMSPYHQFDNSIYGQDMNSPTDSDDEKTSEAVPMPDVQSSSSPTNQNTYESIPRSLPRVAETSLSSPANEYAYADRETVGTKVTTGFNTDKDVEADMEDNAAYVSSTTADGRASLVASESIAHNPLYGGN